MRHPHGLRAAAGGLDSGIAIGTSMEGGYFAGYISHTANGVATHGLIVAPAASGYNGESTLQYKTTFSFTSGTSSAYDGAANTANMSNVTHPAANYCANLTIGGYSDWYLPARYELEIAYFNFKPTTANNTTGAGVNAYSVPKRTTNYTTSVPGQTTVPAFQSGGTEDFLASNHWSSTQGSGEGVTAWQITFTNGAQGDSLKDNVFYVRAFRKFAV